MVETLRKYRLQVTEDKMAVLLDGELPVELLDLTAQAIHDELVDMGIHEPPSAEVLERRLKIATKESPELQGWVILKGKPSVPPVDGKIEWAGDFFNPGFVVDEDTGAIDFRQRAAQVSVEEGQLLARIYKSHEGEEGRDVFGNAITVRKAKQLRLRLGSNVRRDDEEGAIYSEKNGRIRWNNNLVYVDEVLTVTGSVGLETGHISHPGALVVQEDVLEGAEVRTNGDIEVRGVVEAALIRTKGNLTVRGGITRARNPGIEVAGHVHAKFILDSNIRAGGDIVVEKEIVNSTAEAGGKITMPRGRVVGGEVKSFGNITVGQAGSEGSVPTTLLAGNAEKILARQIEIDALREELAKKRVELKELGPMDQTSGESVKRKVHSDLLAKVAKMEKALQVMENELEQIRAEESQEGIQLCIAIEEDIERIREKMHFFLDLSMPPVGKSIAPEKRRIQTRIMGRIARIAEALVDLEGEVLDIREEEQRSQGGARPCIMIQSKLHPDTTLCLDNQTLTLRKARHGPLQAVWEEGEIKIT